MIKKILIVFIFAICFFPSVSRAADISFSADKNAFAQNEEFLVKVMLDTKGVQVNAIEGTVVFPSNLLELTEIRDGNSSINFWIDKPQLKEEGNIEFSGITPGGFSGADNLIFSIVFKAKNLGDAALDFKSIKVLQNDGAGTAIETNGTPYQFSVKLSGSMPENLSIVDNDPPEDFNPSIANDPSIFDGKYFLVFSTVDKGSGMDHYEVRESLNDSDPYVYHVATSPYLLQDQALKNKIYVKAVDKAGNEKIVQVKSYHDYRLFLLLLVFVILLSICIVIIRKKGRKSLKR